MVDLCPANASGGSRGSAPLLRLAPLLFAIGWIVVVGLAAVPSARARPDLSSLTALLTACAAGCAVVLGTLCVAHRQVEDVAPHPATAGLAFIAYGVVIVGGLAVHAPLRPSPSLAVVLGVGVVMTLVALGAARVREPHHPLAAVVGAAVAALVVLAFRPRVAQALAATVLAAPTTPASRTAQWGIAVAWAAVAALNLRRDTVGSRDVAGALVAAGLVQARLATLLAAGGGSAWVLGSVLMELVGIVVALGVVAREYRDGLRSQRQLLQDSIAAARTEDVRTSARRALDAALAHDLRSALFAIEGGARTLLTRDGALTAADRVALTEVVCRGAEHLKTLIESRTGDTGVFRVDEVVNSVVRYGLTDGLAVTAQVPADLWAGGRREDVAVAIETLLHSPALAHEQVRVEAVAEPCRVGVLVGPADIADAGVDVSPQSASYAIDLEVATRLIRGFGGDIRPRAHGDGRVSFRLDLTAAMVAGGEVSHGLAS